MRSGSVNRKSILPPVGQTIVRQESLKRYRTIRYVGLCAGLATLVYVGIELLYGLTLLALFNCFFLAGYGMVLALMKPERLRGLGVLLVGAGLLQITGTAFLFLPPSSGTHLFLLVIPLFAVAAIEPRDWFWWGSISLCAVGLLVYFEFARDAYLPPFWEGEGAAQLPFFRALAALVSTLFAVGAFWVFYRDLRAARARVRAAYEQVEGQLRNMLMRERGNAERQLEFFSRVSHELRTPLAAIGAASDLLAKHQNDLTPEQIEGRIEKIQTSTLQLRTLIGDTLDVSRLRTASLSSNPSEFDLCEVLEDVFQTARLFGDETVTGEFNPSREECPVYMDEKLFRHVVTNLISNAFKYADGGKVTVSLSSIGDSAVEIMVQDTGIGMSEEDLAKLFTPFHRGGNVASIAGTGLGMSIAKDATTLMGGKLDLESELGVGTVAKITLPFHAPEQDDWEVESEWIFPATQTGSVPQRDK